MYLVTHICVKAIGTPMHEGSLEFLLEAEIVRGMSEMAGICLSAGEQVQKSAAVGVDNNRITEKRDKGVILRCPSQNTPRIQRHTSPSRR